MKLLLIILIGSIYASAQDFSPRFSYIGVKEGLPHAIINSIFQDSRGFLWISTESGLSRYDGKSFINYSSRTQPVLANDKIVNVVEDKAGMIWIGTKWGVSRLNPATDSITNFLPGNSDSSLPAGWCIVFVTSANELWVGHDKGISKFNPNTGSFTNYPLTLNGIDDRQNIGVANFLEDDKGRFWVSTSFGVKHVDPATGKYISYHLPEEKSRRRDNACNEIFQDSKKRIWVGTWDGLLLFNEATKKFEKRMIISKDRAGSQNTILSLTEYHWEGRDYLFVSSFDGVIAIDFDELNKTQIENYKVFNNRTSNLTHNHISRIFKDSHDNLWVVTEIGLFFLDPRNQAVRKVFSPPAEVGPLYGIHRKLNDAESYILLGTTGVYDYDLDENKINRTILNPSQFSQTGIPRDIIISDEGYWFSSRDGLFFFNNKTNKLKSYAAAIQKAAGIARTDRLAMDNKGRIWFTVLRTGLGYLEPESGVVNYFTGDKFLATEFGGRQVSDITVDGEKTWVSVQNKLYCFSDSGRLIGKWIMPANAHLQMNYYVDEITKVYPAGNDLILATRVGLKMFSNNQFIDIVSSKGRISDHIYDLKLDKWSNLWMTSPDGILRLDMNTKKLTRYTVFDGLVNNDVWPEFLLLDDKKNMVIINEKNLTILDYHDTKTGAIPLKAIITNISTPKFTQLLSPLQIAPKNLAYQDDIAFEFTTINFSTLPNHFSYRLVGWNDKWTEVTNQTSVRYAQLPPGKYRFEVRARSDDALWDTSPAVFEFHVNPPFWQTWWFITGLVLITASIIYSIYRYRLKQMLRLEKMRTRIATDLHDDIGATLSSISFYSEAIKQQTTSSLPQLNPLLDKMGETSRDIVGNMNDIVWAINPKNDDPAKLISRMRNYAAELCSLTDVQLHFTAEPKANSLKLDMEQRRNIFLIYKEAVVNALKYSGTKHLYISLRVQHNRFIMEVQDEGKGFDPTLEYEGNGIKNMPMRAEQIGGTVNFRKGYKNGTIVCFEFPLT